MIWDSQKKLSIDENNNSFEEEILNSINLLEINIGDLELKTLFDGKYDIRNAIVSIHAGAGGVESQDWASMIMRMYLRWAEKMNMTSKILEISKGDEAGIKSTTIHINCLLYTSDAADDMQCVDLGGRRII